MSATASRRQRIRWAIRSLQAAIATTVVFGVWLIGFAPDGGTPEVLPDTTEQFSLDLKVVASTDAPVVYVVEQRARPSYRIFAFNPSTGEEETIFTVPDDAIIYGIDLNASGRALAVIYSPDHALDGSGLWVLDIADGTFTEISPVQTNVYLTDPEWTDDSTAVLATRVDRTTENESLAVASIDINSGAVTSLVANAVDPIVSGDLVHYLAVEDGASARRSIHSLDLTTGIDQVVASGDFDLDHLLDGDTITVAALETGDDAATLTLGTPAAAHGNHDVPSTWWHVTTPAPYDLEATTVYDADRTGDHLVYVTREGLSIATDTKVDLIESRALRFITV